MAKSCHLHLNNLLDVLSHLYLLQGFRQVVDFIVDLGNGTDEVLLGCWALLDILYDRIV